MAQDHVIERVRELIVRDFRGLVSAPGTAHHLDTDGDIVLVVGANGHGKSSILEALLLAVTGAALPRREKDTDSLLSRHVGADGAEAVVAPSLTVQARCRVADAGGDRTLTTAGSRGGAFTRGFEAAGELSSHRAWSDAGKLPARLTAFFQDDVDRIFDDVSRGDTLLNVAAPLPATHEAIATALRKVAKECLDKARENLPPGDPATRPADERTFADWVEALRTIVAAARRLHPSWPEPPTSGKAAEWRASMEQLVDRGPKESLPARTRQWVEENFDGWEAEAKRKARSALDDEQIRALERQRDDADAELHRLATDYPRLDEDLAAFEGRTADPGDLPSLLEVLEALFALRGTWIASARARREYAELARELEAIDIAKLDGQRRALATWLRDRRHARARREVLSRQREDATRQLDGRAVDSEDLRAVRAAKPLLGRLSDLGPWQKVHGWLLYDEDAGLRELRRERLLDLAGRLEGMATGLRADDLAAPACMKALRNALDQVAARFKLGQGALPLRLDDTIVDAGDSERPAQMRLAKISFHDGRELAHFSTGQRSQAAVAFMVAQNLLVGNSTEVPRIVAQLPHRVLILDDVATSYDLSNLVVETLLWRQLAYTDNPLLKRQIFIASHHDDLTNQLIDLLAPPGAADDKPGFELRILRITDWSPTSGPEIKQQRVVPTRRTPQKEEEAARLCRDLEAVLFEGRS